MTPFHASSPLHPPPSRSLPSVLHIIQHEEITIVVPPLQCHHSPRLRTSVDRTSTICTPTLPPSPVIPYETTPDPVFSQHFPALPDACDYWIDPVAPTLYIQPPGHRCHAPPPLKSKISSFTPPWETPPSFANSWRLSRPGSLEPCRSSFLPSTAGSSLSSPLTTMGVLHSSTPQNLLDTWRKLCPRHQN